MATNVRDDRPTHSHQEPGEGVCSQGCIAIILGTSAPVTHLDHEAMLAKVNATAA